MKKNVITIFVLLLIVSKFLYPYLSYLSFWSSNIYLSEFDKTLTVLEENNSNTNKFLLDGVVDYQIEKQYLLLLRMVIITNDTSITYTGVGQYWAIEYSTGRKFGPFMQNEFNKFLNANKLGKNRLSIPESYWNYCTKQCGEGR